MIAVMPILILFLYLTAAILELKGILIAVKMFASPDNEAVWHPATLRQLGTPVRFLVAGIVLSCSGNILAIL
jgi:hypothetical protein